MKNNQTFVGNFTSSQNRVYSVFVETVGEDLGEAFYAEHPCYRRPYDQFSIYDGETLVGKPLHESQVKEFVYYYEHPGSAAGIGSRFD
jgi:hypothetical protein